MTKKKPSPQNRIWEKERRERLNKTFEDLQRLLPDHEPASTLSKVEILQRAIEHINKLQKKIKMLVEECSDPLKDHVKEQEQRLKRLLVRNEELAELLRKAKITVPPCKYTINEEEIQRLNEEKENGNRQKKTAPKQRRSGAVPKKHPVIENQPPASVASSEALGLSIVKSIPASSSDTSSCCNSGDTMTASCPPTARHLNSIPTGNGVNVTPALLPTPIMTTSVIISNNGNLVQVPIVAPPSSLLIVGNEDVRSKINLKNRPNDGNSSRYRGKRGKFMIKSIDLIPGRIKNGKIPIPPLRRNTNDILKSSKVPRLKRKRVLEKCKRLRRSSTSTTTKENKTQDTCKAKRARLHEQVKSHNESSAKGNALQQEQNGQALETLEQQPCSDVPAVNKIILKEHHKTAQPNEPTQENHLDISLNQTDLSEDIFANLHVGPDGANVHDGNEDGTLSPTAAYLMNFPLVAGGGKAAGNHADSGEADECHDSGQIDQHSSKPNNASTNEQTSSMMLDNFSSIFNYGHMDTMCVPTVGQDITTLHSIPVLPVHTTTTIATASSVPAISSRETTFTNYPTIYQSIDNMLDSRPMVPNISVVGGSTNRSLSTESDFPGSVTFTFTLTSNTSTAPTTSQPTIGSGHYYGTSCGGLNAMKPVDDFSSPLKPSIEFTFSLTSTTASQPKTVQSQYTNSTILAPTMTTPSYDTYGYFHKGVPKSSNYCSSFNVLDPLLATEKPATSFTFSLTSSTKTEPSYTQSTIVTVPTNTTQAYGTPPKLSIKQHQTTVESTQTKQELAAKPEKSRTTQRTNIENGPLRSGPTNSLQPHQQQQNQSQQQTQSKYDVSWMAAGVHHGHSTVPSQNSHSQQQMQQQSVYETVPAQIMPPIEFPPTGGYTSTNNYKSDIFFAHPPGDEHNLTWSSPSKLSNILNDSSSPYFPPVTLPSLNGDLALNTSGSGNTLGGGGGGTGLCPSNKINTPSVSSCKVSTNPAKKAYTQSGSIGTVQNETSTSGSFLSVSQLVNEPSKSFHNNSNVAIGGNSNAGLCQQKLANNNYSAEALIGTSYTQSTGFENGRKEKLFDYGTSGLDAAPSAPGPLTFNFDTYGGNTSGVDYNKGYNFANQQNSYMTTSYADPSYGGASQCGGSNAIPSSGIPYYGKTSSTQGYYNQPSMDSSNMMDSGSVPSIATNHPNTSHSQSTAPAGTMGQEYTPYYLPSFGEKKNYSSISHSGSSGPGISKSKKSNKASGAVSSAAEYVASTMSSSASSYSYSTVGNSSNIAAVGSSHESMNHVAPQNDPLSYPNYHARHHNYHHHQQQRLPSQQSGSVALQATSTATRKVSSTSTTTSSSYNYNLQYLSTKAAQQPQYETPPQSSYPAPLI
uniref:BHLH domain-containing protein n=1 Tax=Anopheles epiroticus TaxID=199890 RepID=A0A182P1R0_9DIPT